jgi:3-hydroxyacyl-CoA dehydrogenase
MAGSPQAIDVVGVVGGGLMGSGIAETVARAGGLTCARAR